MKILNFLTILAVAAIISCQKNNDNPVIGLNNVISDWEISKDKHNFDITPKDIFFINSNIGYVVGLNGNIYKTENAGESWEKQNSGTSLHLNSVFFLNKEIGFISGKAMNGCLDNDCDKGSILLKTNDGGKTWVKTLFKDYTSIKSVRFFDELKGLAIIHTPDIPNSRDYYIAKTSDGGLNWESIDLAIKPTYDKFLCVENVVFIAGEDRKIFKSNDYGNNWETISTPIPTKNYVRNIYFYNENIGFADGVTSIYKTIDGGKKWEIYNFPFSSFGIFHFYNEVEGFNIKNISEYEGGDFPVYKGSISYQTYNGGENWRKSELINSLNLSITHFPKKDLGYGINLSEFYIIKKK